MTKPAGSLLQNIPEVEPPKAAEPIQQIIPYQTRNLDRHCVTSCAGRCSFPPAGVLLHKFRYYWGVQMHQ